VNSEAPRADFCFSSCVGWSLAGKAMSGDAAAAAAVEPEAKRRRKEVVESIPEALNAGRDPRVMTGKDDHVLNRAAESTLIGITSGENEERCYLLAEYEQLGRFLPSSIKRDTENPLLPRWDFMKLLPTLEWWSVVFEQKDSPGTYRVVPDSKLSLEDYPAASRSKKDPETLAGFATRKDLRIVLKPQAFRFFWYGLHEPLASAGVPRAARARDRQHLRAREAGCWYEMVCG
jgi:hypothetical protein